MSGSALLDTKAPQITVCLLSVLTRGSLGLKSTVAHPFWLLFSMFYVHAVYNDFN